MLAFPFVSLKPIATAWHLVLLNVGVGLVTVLMLVGPSFLVTRILPVKAIRFN